MQPAQRLWEESRAVAEECLAHPFVRGMADGSLDPARYRDFIAQDAYFLEAFARGYGHCLSRSIGRDDLLAFHRLLDGVFAELELHQGVARRLGIDLASLKPAPATLDYTGFLAGAIAAGATIGEMLAAMTPCMRLYAYLGAELAGRPALAVRPYQEWIEAYSNGEFQALATLIESLLDRHATGSPDEQEHYRRAMELELRFFDGAWQGPPGAEAQAAPADTETLIVRHRARWREATAATSFVAGIREGTLRDEAWRRWLAQDYLFVDGLTRAQERILPGVDADARRVLADGVTALRQELAWFEEHAGRYRLDLHVEPSEDCTAYVAFLDSLASARPAVSLTAIWTVERAYLDAWRAARPGAPAYREFVEHWTSEAFEAYVAGLAAADDRALARAPSSTDERDEAERVFLRIVAFEQRFWEMAADAASASRGAGS